MSKFKNYFSKIPQVYLTKDLKLVRGDLICFKISKITIRIYRASLVVQWLRICLPMRGTWVRALVQEDPTCRGATKPVRHNY